MFKKIVQIKKLFLIVPLLGFLFLIYILLPWHPNEKQFKEIAQQVLTKPSFPLELNYRSYFGKVPVGSLKLTIRNMEYQNQTVYKTNLSIRPFNLLRKISKDSVGLELESAIDRVSLLPFYFIENTASGQRKGKLGKKIEYNHERLILTRKGSLNDIEEDTRDMLSFFVWLMRQDYLNKDIVKSTINVKSRVQLMLGKVQERRAFSFIKGEEQIVKVKINILRVGHGYAFERMSSLEAYLVKNDQWYIPLFFIIEVKGQQFYFQLVN